MSLLVLTSTGLLGAGLVAGQDQGTGCPHPSVPAGATYSNVTGGLGQDSWKITYICDIGRRNGHLNA